MLLGDPYQGLYLLGHDRHVGTQTRQGACIHGTLHCLLRLRLQIGLLCWLGRLDPRRLRWHRWDLLPALLELRVCLLRTGLLEAGLLLMGGLSHADQLLEPWAQSITLLASRSAIIPERRSPEGCSLTLNRPGLVARLQQLGRRFPLLRRNSRSRA